MAEMNGEYINAFLVAASSVMQTACGITLTAGQPYVKTTAFDTSAVVICLGVTGQIGGQVLIAAHKEVACDLASKMCMMPILQLDEISLSALSELGNMILGNAATVLSTKNVMIDITPPMIIQGDFKMDRVYARNICLPMQYDDGKVIEIDVSLTEARS